MTTYFDPRRLDTIISNLVGNALEHGEPPVRVTVTATPTQVDVEVSDSGEGISPEHLPHLFDRFHKGDPSRPRSAGSGLGLAIARENVRLHDGDILVTSHPGTGASFALVLPLRREAPAATGPRTTADVYPTRPSEGSASDTEPLGLPGGDRRSRPGGGAAWETERFPGE
ncbi:MAG: ATP-binding protein [Actinomycetota bacterium]|nr:ATP-binding protein [Actinomycetota bacterium]